MTELRSISASELESALTFRDRAAWLYLHQPNITMVDVGYRMKNRQLTNQLTVRVHVKKKLEQGPQLEAYAATVPAAIVDATAVGFPTDVIEGDYKLHAAAAPWWWIPDTPAENTLRQRPLRPGISISNASDFNFATLGGFVKDRATGAVMILSYWHVIVNSDYRRPGLRIFQPGSADGGWDNDTIATYTRDAMSQGIDAAVAQLAPGIAFLKAAGALNPPSGASEPKLGMTITKAGRKTGVTTGIIDGVGGIQTVNYTDGKQRTIRYVTHIMPAVVGAQTSQGGDSGSWWLNTADSRAVGLHFAGSDEPEYALAISMPQVLDALNIDIA